MSSDLTSTLLPTARVDFYISDQTTAAVVEKLSADWRFARVDINIVQAGVDQAIATYTEYASPDILFLETDDISESFTQSLESLAGVCEEGTEAVIIGPTNDVHLYRFLIGLGVRDYLVRPVDQEDIVSVIAKVLVEQHGITGARLVAVLGGKGGVGTTTTTQLLAWIIAEKLKQKTLLIDAAGSNSTLGIALGLEATTSFSEAIRMGREGSDEDLARILQSATENLTVLVCGGDPVMSVRPDADMVEALVTRLLQKSPVVVMDLSGSSRAVQQRMISLASEVVFVTTPMLPSLRNARTYLNEIKNMRDGMDGVDLVLNMQGMAGKEEVPHKDIETALGVDLAAIIPYAPKVFAVSEASGKAAGENSAAAEILQAMLPIASRSADVALESSAAKQKSTKDDVLSVLKGLMNKE